MARAPHLPPRWRTSRAAVADLGDRRGFLLVIAILLLLALSSVGLVAVQRSNTEIRYVGNVRRGSVAYRVTEGGARASLAYAHSLGAEGFAATWSATAVPAGGLWPRWSSDDMASDGVTFYDLGPSGSFGYEGYLDSTDSTTTEPPVEVAVEISETGLRQPMVGYSFTGPGSRCRFKYQFDARGSVGSDGAGEPTDASFGVWKMIRALMYVGPLPCDQAPTLFGETS